MVSKTKDSRMDNGRIADIIGRIHQKHGVTSLESLSDEDKLTGICEFLKITKSDLDNVIADNPQVLRPVKGHCFEIVFDRIMSYNGIQSIPVGGDTDIDRRLNGHTLQLKTPHEGGTDGDIVSYKTHLTHGAKSVSEGEEYLHDVSSFPTYLVGLVTYRPFTIVVLKHDELPTDPNHPERIQSPFNINWRTHPGLDAYNRMTERRIEIPSWVESDIGNSELLPRSSKIIGVSTGIILDSILRQENFRIWDMSILGFLRQHCLDLKLRTHSVIIEDAQRLGLTRPEKIDLVLMKSDNKPVRFQLKGITRSQCKLEPDVVVDIETQLSRGRVNDHETQSRLYKITDFDFLIVSIEPPIISVLNKCSNIEEIANWSFFSIPVSRLSVHPDFPNRLKSHQKISYRELRRFEIGEGWFSNWKKKEDARHKITLDDY